MVALATFIDKDCNIAQLEPPLKPRGKFFVRLVRPGISLERLEYVGHTNNQPVYVTHNKGERTPDVAYGFFEGTRGQIEKQLKGAGFQPA